MGVNVQAIIALGTELAIMGAQCAAIGTGQATVSRQVVLGYAGYADLVTDAGETVVWAGMALSLGRSVLVVLQTLTHRQSEHDEILNEPPEHYRII